MIRGSQNILEPNASLGSKHINARHYHVTLHLGTASVWGQCLCYVWYQPPRGIQVIH